MELAYIVALAILALLGGLLAADHRSLVSSPAPLMQLALGLALMGGVMGLSGLWRGAMAQRPKL